MATIPLILTDEKHAVYTVIAPNYQEALKILHERIQPLTLTELIHETS